MNPESKFANANGINLHYLDWGGDGPPVVMVHASSFCADVWGPIAESLSQRYHSMAIDQRGHGRSDKPPGPYAWENFGQDLSGFIEALGLKDVIAIGHSTGGTHVLLAAANKPGLISKAVVFEPTIWSHDDWHGMARRNADWVRRRRPIWDSREQAFKSFRPRSPFGTWREDIVRAYVQGGFEDLPDGRVALGCPPEIEAELYENVSNLDPKKHLPSITCPVLWIVGGYSHPMQKAMMERGAGLVKSCRLLYISGTGHFIPMDKPEESLAVILQFLSA